MPKIVLKDGSEFIIDQAILEDNILPAKSDEMIQLGRTLFKKSSIEIIHEDNNTISSKNTITSISKLDVRSKTDNRLITFIKEKISILTPTKNQLKIYIINIIWYLVTLIGLFAIFYLIILIVPYLYSFLPSCNIFIFDFWDNGNCN